MILLDTSVVSALMSPAPARTVVDWLDLQPSETLYLSAVTIAEIRLGLRVLPGGRRRRDLEGRFDRFLGRGFAHRILGFDEKAARFYAKLMAHRRSVGRPMSTLDGQIAGTARAHRFAVATRNVPDFEECGLDLVNPFEESA